MRRYTIANILTLFLSVLSVVARGLPGWRSEINVRSPGDVGSPRRPLEELGLVKVSEGVLNGNIHTAIYSMSNSTTFPKRDTRSLDIRGGRCSTFCQTLNGMPYPDLGACAIMYQGLQSTVGTFIVNPGETATHTLGECSFYLVNSSLDTSFTYDNWDLGNTMEWLTGHCFIGQNTNAAYCVYPNTGIDSLYIRGSRRV